MKHSVRRKKPARIITEHRGRVLSEEDGLALRVEWTRSFNQKREANLMAKRFARVDRLPAERQGLERAKLSVEQAFVKAIWVIERLHWNEGPRLSSGGLSYVEDQMDRYIQALANGGWQTPAPRPAVPSSKDISNAERVQLWTTLLAPDQGRLLITAAMTKRGDAGRKVDWDRVRKRMPELEGYSQRSLQGRYVDALETLVSELSAAQLSQMA